MAVLVCSVMATVRNLDMPCASAMKIISWFAACSSTHAPASTACQHMYMDQTKPAHCTKKTCSANLHASSTSLSTFGTRLELFIAFPPVIDFSMVRKVEMYKVETQRMDGRACTVERKVKRKHHHEEQLEMVGTGG